MVESKRKNTGLVGECRSGRRKKEMKEIRECEFCEKETECEETINGHWFCCYACLEAFYLDEVPEKEDFKKVAM